MAKTEVITDGNSSFGDADPGGDRDEGHYEDALHQHDAGGRDRELYPEHLCHAGPDPRGIGGQCDCGRSPVELGRRRNAEQLC